MNENASGLPEAFVRETFASIDPGFLAAYPEYSGLLDRLSARAGLPREWLLLAAGLETGLEYALQAFVSPGDRVLMADPSFGMYALYCRVAEGVPVEVPYPENLEFPFEAWMAALRSGVRLAILANPNNPTGDALDRERLLAIAKEAERTGTILLVDEAYFGFHSGTVLDAVRDHPALVVLRTFSKLCAAAGLRLGWMAGRPELLEPMRRVKPTFDVNAVAVRFAERILDDPDLVPGLVARFREARDWFLGRLAAEGVDHVPGHANFLLVRCSGRAAKVVQRLAERKILVKGGFPNPGLTDAIRVTIGDRTSMERFLAEFLAILRG